MPVTILPYVTEEPDSGCAHGPDCPLRGRLSPELWQACEKAPFLAEYLHHLPMDVIGMPVYCEKLSRTKQAGNVIYPIDGGLYVHIYPDAGGQRDYYVSVEPTIMLNLDPLMAKVEVVLMRWAEEIGRLEDEAEKKELLTSLVD